jgi:hypothetical protein
LRERGLSRRGKVRASFPSARQGTGQHCLAILTEKADGFILASNNEKLGLRQSPALHMEMIGSTAHSDR